MRVILQRVTEASVKINGEIKSEIGLGFLVLLGIAEDDNETDSDWIINKIVNLRVFGDDEGLMNKSIKEVQGSLLIISQFTLLAKTKKGNRPSFIKAAKPDNAIPMYESFLEKAKNLMDKEVGSGVFGADMKVSLINDGPVTITIDSKLKE